VLSSGLTGLVRWRRRIGQTAVAVALAATLAACGGSSSGPMFPGFGAAPSGPGLTTQAPSGEIIGNGSVRVALLVPSSAQGQAASIAPIFKNAARMAMNDFPNGDVQLLVKDTGGTAEGARAAAQQAVAEGAELIIGPVFAPAVNGAAAVARPAGVPIIAFSSDASVASRGVYLLSFLPKNDVRRIVSYSVARGKKSFAAIVPNNAYGGVAEAAFREYAGQYGARVLAIERYAGTEADIKEKAENIARLGGQIDAVFMTDGGAAVPIIARTLVTAGVNPQTVKFVGTGQWDSPAILSAPSLAGGWFAGPSKKDFPGFASRYAGQFGSPPPRTATLAYDATILSLGLVRSAGSRRFAEDVLTSSDGFLGIDGVFRLRNDGTNQRGLAIYEVKSGSATVVDPAPRSFAGF